MWWFSLKESLVSLVRKLETLRWNRVFMVGLPLLAVLGIGGSLFIGAREEALLSGRVVGGPTSGGWSGRIQVIRDEAGVARPQSDLPVQVEYGGQKFLATTGAEGWISLPFTANSGDLHFRAELFRKSDSGTKDDFFTGQRSSELVDGFFRVSPDDWRALSKARGHFFELEEWSDEEKALGWRLDGPLAVPFSTEMLLTYDGRSPLSIDCDGAEISWKASDALKTQDSLYLKPDGQQQKLLRLLLTPRTHHVDLHIKNGARSLESSPVVVPGGADVRREDQGYRIRTPLLKDRIWWSLVSSEQRWGGGVLALQSEEGGGATGFLPDGELPACLAPQACRERWLVVASDADAIAVGTVGFPLDGQAHSFAPEEILVLDGFERARRSHQAQVTLQRWALAGYAAMASLFFLFLFFIDVRREARQQKRAFERIGAKGGTADDFSRALIVAFSSLFFAFSLLVVWIVAQ
ncbi:MAG: hypothetical protein MK135_00995 [Polyangiaceae bacterium]|nr:hypothetical protein [Polyangiaceae bacterium]